MSMQSRRLSIIEQTLSTFIGLVVSFFVQLGVFPLFGMEVTLLQNFELLAIFTVASVIRGYFVRRTFNRFHGKLESWFGAK